ncbi:MAG TPA: hypothetical protein VMA74_20755 [Dyella sp.]|uniref:hypothetical protein n=1 Tax=Dyella sp. TaxID=1869338 RepID=UPI002C7AB3E3|nr:hypothetical protein [Dyella sp.]HUB92167.1 hypothetical protein [Dyella sp.]
MARNAAGQEDGYGKLRFGRGVDNRSEKSRLEEGFSRIADNLDISTNAVLTPREGSTLKAALTGAHSLHAFEHFPYAFVGDAKSIYRMDSNYNLVQLVSGLNGTTIYYEQLGNKVFWSNGSANGIVNPDGSTAPWGIETPLPSFAVTAVSNGGMYCGRYGLTLTFESANGEESGAPEPVFLDVPDGGGIQVTNLSPPSTNAPQRIRFYCTQPNGTDLLFSQTAPVNTSQWTLGAQILGRPLTTLLKDPMPPATHLLAKAGCIFGAVGNLLMWTDPLYYGVTDLSNNYIPFASPLRMIAAPESVRFILYVSDGEKVHRLEGASIATASRVTVQSQGCVPGSMVMVPADALNLNDVFKPVPVWIGGEGIPYAGTEEGAIPLHDKFVYPIYDNAAAMFLRRNGANRYLVAGQGGRTSALAMSDCAEIRIVP